MENQRFFYDALERRSKRLAKLIELSAPSHLINQEVVLIVRAAIRYSPRNAKELVRCLISVGRKEDFHDEIELEEREICQ